MTLTVSATGAATLTYQWQLDGTDIPGATSSSLTIDPIGRSDEGEYAAVVSNSCSSVTSATAVIELGDPLITEDLVDSSVCDGDAVTLSVTATSPRVMSYQWQFDGTDISGATASSLTIDPASSSDVGDYTVVITTTCGSVTSSAAALSVVDSVTIDTDPASTVGCVGGSVTLTVVASGTALEYQWRKDSVDISGATAASLTLDELTSEDVADYDVVVTSNCGTATSAAATLTVNDPVTITAEPSSTTLCEAEMLSLSVTATGTTPLTYQWRKDGSDIAGATASSFSITSVSTDDDGDYDVVVTNDCGSLTSATATVTVDALPQITIEPTDQEPCLGDTVTLTVTATGASPLTYQWRLDGTDIIGATSSSYSITSAATSDEGNYDVVVTNDCGTTTSALANLTIADVVITSDPSGGVFCIGDSVTLSVTATGAATISYQWQLDGSDISGATGSTHTIDPLAFGDEGDYSVVVSNGCGSVTSATATVEIGDALITSDLSDTTACVGDAVTLSVTATSPQTLSYQWLLDGTAISGETGSSLTIDPVASADAGDYTVEITTTCATVTSATAVLTVEVPVSIDTDPGSDTVCVGDSVTLTVAVSGTSLLYQWRKDSTDISGATSSSYTISSAQSGDAADYDVVVSNDCNSITSAAATLTVNDPVTISTEPSSTDLCENDSLSLSVTATGTSPLTYQWQLDGSDISGATSSSYSVTSVTTSDAGDYVVVVTNDCGSVDSAAATVTVDELPRIVTDPSDAAPCIDDSVTFSVTITGTAPITYQWRLDGSDITGATSSSYTIDNVASGDAGDYDVVVANDCGTATSAAATLSISDPVISTDPTGGTHCLGDSVTLSVTASGAATLTYQWQLDGSDLSGATSDSYTIDTLARGDDGDYTVVVTNSCGSVTSATATIEVGDPFIETEPTDVSACENDSATFSVTATSPQSLSYQWQLDGTDITGATSSSLTIDPVGLSDAGDYTVVITSSCGTTTSAAAALSVNDGIVIDTQPESQTACLDDIVTFTVEDTSVATVSYQWRKDGTDITGETTSSLTLSAITVDDEADYDVVLTSSCGNLTSDVATLTVSDPPTITVDPSDTTVCTVDSLDLSVTATSTATLSYQWRKDGVDISGETSSTLSFASIVLGDAAEYDVVVTNICGTATSAIAIVTVVESARIDEQPDSATICEGESITLTVVATGTDLLYQWQKDGTDIVGATESTYTIDSITVDDADDYTVTISNDCNSLTSSTATLTVGTAPTAISDLTCELGSEDCANTDVSLTWTNNDTYDEIEVYRDGVLLDNLDGDRLFYLDLTATESDHNYELVAIVADDDCDRVTTTSDSCDLVDAVLKDFIRGDFNNDEGTDIADPIFGIKYLFLDGLEPPCMDAGDANDDGLLNLADPIFMLKFLFLEGTDPPAPYPDEGPDDTCDLLDCKA